MNVVPSVPVIDLTALQLVSPALSKFRAGEYRSSLKAQMDAMEQRRAVGTARRAFTAAAREASVFLREGRSSR